MSYPAVIVKCMFDTDRPSSVCASALPPAEVAASPAGPARVPLERLEAQIRQYLEDAPRRTGPTLIPIQV
jgi:hypothetical protein